MPPFRRDRKIGGGRPKRDRRPPKRGGFGRGRRSDSGRRSSKEMHSVKCDKCGKMCEVPFKPTTSKPVYCSDCFRKDDSSRSRSKPSFGKELDLINQKLDRIMEELEIDF